VFFFLTGNGWVQTDDYSITPYIYPPFNQGLVTLTFDDGFEGNVTTVLPKLAEYNFKSTHCFATQYIEGIPEQIQNVQAIGNAGHEVCAHTVTHPFLTQSSDAQIDYELSHSKTLLESTSGQQITSFASPYGDYDVRVNNKIKQHFETHRTTDEGFNAKDNLSAYRLRVQNMTPNTTLAEFSGWVNKAKNDKTWLILLYHAITPSNPGAFDTLKSEFDKQVDTLAASGIKVSTWRDAYAEVKVQ
jgi:peptidoglycan/xylan/chitin deacetylase (PgdA/CDA1 family)